MMGLFQKIYDMLLRLFWYAASFLIFAFVVDSGLLVGRALSVRRHAWADWPTPLFAHRLVDDDYNRLR